MTVLPGLGPGRAARLAAAGLATVRALLSRPPCGYLEPARGATREDLERASAGDAPAEAPPLRVRLRARVRSVSCWPPGGPRAVLTVRLAADAAPEIPVRAVYFGQPYLKKNFPAGRVLTLEGPLLARRGATLASPRVVAEGAAAAPEPEYAAIDGVPAAVLRRAIAAALPALAGWPEPLPPARLAEAGVPPLGEALRLLHAPRDEAERERGRRRLALEEILRLERAHRAERAAAPAGGGRAVAPATWERIRARLPFILGADQEAALAALRDDLGRGARVRRLLHGEVGSGKTAVAFALALAIAADGGQAALLAPTEILARQHLAQFRAWLRGSKVDVIGLLGDDPPRARAAALARLVAPRPAIAVGTHALFSPGIRFARLRLVVFDEQHRFGVRQKAALLAKGEAPHVLTMTATPIPRTLAWARYGALDPLVLRARAAGAAAVSTRVLPAGSWPEEAARLRPALEGGARAFFVAPRIDGAGGLTDCHASLRAGPWRGLPLALAHGRMPGAELERAVARFRAGEARALCGTSVVEVGLDVPGVEHMLVVGAERFGLASLHQLRGRLARGADARPAECLVFAAEEARPRLALLETCDDGFRVAEADLAARGPGTLRGLRQHGAAGFRLFDPARDGDLVDRTRSPEWETALRSLD